MNFSANYNFRVNKNHSSKLGADLYRGGAEGCALHLVVSRTPYRTSESHWKFAWPYTFSAFRIAISGLILTASVCPFLETVYYWFVSSRENASVKYHGYICKHVVVYTTIFSNTLYFGTQIYCTVQLQHPLSMSRVHVIKSQYKL